MLDVDVVVLQAHCVQPGTWRACFGCEPKDGYVMHAVKGPARKNVIGFDTDRFDWRVRRSTTPAVAMKVYE